MVGFGQRIDDVLLVFEIRIAEHGVEREQAIQLARADVRIGVIRPGIPRVETVQVRILLTESGRQLRIRRWRLGGVPLSQVVDRRLMVSDAPQNPGGGHFRLCLRRKLRTPLAILLIDKGVSAAEPGTLDFNDGIPCRRIGRELRSSHAVKQIPVCGRLNPELGELSLSGPAGQRGFQRGAAACDKLNSDPEEARREPKKRRVSKSSS
jgi:hypothetical protein